MIERIARSAQADPASIKPIFTALAELSTRQIAESVSATGMGENKAAAKTGGRTAKKARLELEAKTGRRVVTRENYLPPPEDAKQIP